MDCNKVVTYWHRSGGGWIWTEADMGCLRDLAGQHPLVEIRQLFNSWANANDRPTRSFEAIRKRLQMAGLNLRCDSALWVSPRTVMELTGKSKDFLKRLKSKYGIRTRCRSFNTLYSRKDIRKVARLKPNLFAGISKANLLILFESEELADFVHSKYPRAVEGAKPCYVVELGKRYPSLAAAARALHLDPSAARRAVKEKRKCLDYTFRLIA